MLVGEAYVVGDGFVPAGAFFVGHDADQAGRGSGPEFLGSDAFAGSEEAAGAEEACFFDDGAVQDGGAHADEGAFAEFAGVDDGGVADGDVFGDIGVVFTVVDMDDGTVLDVGAGADDDGISVGAQDAIVPDAGIGAEAHVTDQHGGGGDPGGGVDCGPDAVEGVEQTTGFGRRVGVRHGGVPYVKREGQAARASGRYSGRRRQTLLCRDYQAGR